MGNRASCCTGPPGDPEASGRGRAAGPSSTKSCVYTDPEHTLSGHVERGSAGQLLTFHVRVVDRRDRCALQYLDLEGVPVRFAGQPPPQSTQAASHALEICVAGCGALGAIRMHPSLECDEAGHEQGLLKASWRTRRAGHYLVSVKLKHLHQLGHDQHLPGSPFRVEILPGPISAERCAIEGLLQRETKRPLVSTAAHPLHCSVKLRDEYGNSARLSALSHTTSGRVNDAKVAVGRVQAAQAFHVRGLTATAQTAGSTFLCAMDTLDIRSKPRSDSAIVGRVPAGAMLSLVDNAGSAGSSSLPSRVMNFGGGPGRPVVPCEFRLLYGSDVWREQYGQRLMGRYDVVNTPKVRCGKELSSAVAPESEQFSRTAPGTMEAPSAVGIQVFETGHAKNGRARLRFERRPAFDLDLLDLEPEPELEPDPSGSNSDSGARRQAAAGGWGGGGLTRGDLATMAAQVGLDDAELLNDMIAGVDGDLAAVKELLIEAGADTSNIAGDDEASVDPRREMSGAAVAGGAQPGKQQRDEDPGSGSELIPELTGPATCQFKGKGDFVDVWLSLFKDSHGMRQLNVHEGGTPAGRLLRIADMNGCSLKQPKDSRGFQHIRRIDLATEDSLGDAKYVLAITAKDGAKQLDAWISALSRSETPSQQELWISAASSKDPTQSFLRYATGTQPKFSLVMRMDAGDSGAQGLTRCIGWVDTLDLATRCTRCVSGGETKVFRSNAGAGLSWPDAATDWYALIELRALPRSPNEEEEVCIRCTLTRLQEFASEIVDELRVSPEAAEACGIDVPAAPPAVSAGGRNGTKQLQGKLQALMWEWESFFAALECWCSFYSRLDGSLDIVHVLETAAWRRMYERWQVDLGDADDGTARSSLLEPVMFEYRASHQDADEDESGGDGSTLPIEVTVFEPGLFQLSVSLKDYQLSTKVPLLVIPPEAAEASGAMDRPSSMSTFTSKFASRDHFNESAVGLLLESANMFQSKSGEDVGLLSTYDDMEEVRGWWPSQLRVTSGKVALRKTKKNALLDTIGYLQQLLLKGSAGEFSLPCRSTIQLELSRCLTPFRLSGMPTPPHRSLVFVGSDGCRHRICLADEQQRMRVIALVDGFIRRTLGGAQGSVSFASKVKMLKEELERTGYELGGSNSRGNGKPIRIDRDNVLGSFSKAVHRLSSPKDWGRSWALDWGGLSKELFSLLSEQLLCAQQQQQQQQSSSSVSPAAAANATSDLDSQPLFVPVGQDGLLYPNFRCASKRSLELFELAGRFLGKVAVDVAAGRPHEIGAHFARPLYKLLLGFSVGFEDYAGYDSDDTRIRAIVEADEDMLEILDLTFTFEQYDDAEPSAEPVIVELIKNGANVGVTAQNSRQYLEKWAAYALLKRQEKQIDKLRVGFWSVIEPDRLGAFTEQEIELLLCGTPDVSADELQRHTRIRGGENTSLWGATLGWFWATVHAMNPAEIGQLLQFVTGTSRLPAGGFQSLVHPITIECDSSTERNHLPSAHTCFNRLDLPLYSTQHVCEQLVHTAIAEGNEGFAFA